MKYWAYVNNEILGPFDKDKLRELPSFSASLLVCPQTPVGEKTEDWKEASTYPELASLTGGAAQPSPLPEPAAPAAPAPAPQSFPQPAIETASIAFKPLTAAKTVEPIPPSSHTGGMADISVSRLGKTGGAAPEQVAQSSSGFDPISLSQIVRRTEHYPAQETPAQAGEGLSLEPRSSQAAPQPAPEPAPQAPAVPEMPAFTPAAEPPAQEPPPAAAQAPGPTPFSYDTAGLQNLLQRLDQISQTSATRKDIDSALDPVRFKLDQMGEVISSIKNSQFQREVMDKLSYLENAVGELKETLRGGAPPASAPKLQEVTIERNSDTVFGVQSAPAPKQEEKPKPEPAKEPAAPEVKDQGSKPSRLVPVIKKISKFLLTLVLLAAVLIGGVMGLKNFAPGILGKIPPGILSKIPYLGAPAAQPAVQAQKPQADPFTGEGAQPQGQPQGQPQEQEQPQLSPEQQEELRKSSQEQAQRAQERGKLPVPPEAVPEVIYITRTYKAKPAGQSLENKIYEHAGKAGGNYNRTNWEVLAADDGKFTVTAVIPAKGSSLTYTFLVDRAKKSVTPSNEAAKEAFAALSAPAARQAAKPARKKAAAPAAKPAPKPKPAPIQAEEEDEEYEYVYEDETE